MATLNDKQLEMCSTSKWDFSDLKALFINCTLKRSPELSHTQGLIDISKAILEKNGVSVDVLRAVDYDIAYGVWPDMTEHGWENDAWPAILEKVMKSDILVLTSSIWLGEKTSVCTKVIERLYAASGQLNSDGQYAYYGRVGGCLITGNEDGAKHCSMNIARVTSPIQCPSMAVSHWRGTPHQRAFRGGGHGPGACIFRGGRDIVGSRARDPASHTRSGLGPAYRETAARFRHGLVSGRRVRRWCLQLPASHVD